MMTIEHPKAPPAPPDPGVAPGSDEARYLRWVAERVRGEDFWMAVKEDILEDFANLLNRELPDELWRAAYAQRDGRDYLVAFEAVLERLQEYCEQTARRG
ncbi:MAG TPA: hypothetical protein VEU78_05020 [Steroidobacteraceae bacterium]|nr:hypothetical protein [Steroidobacteraceae bacterium]